MRALPGDPAMSHSKKRKRMAIIHARVTAAEKAEVAAKAKALGGISALFRTAVLKYKAPKSKVDQEAYTRALFEFGKVATNINQYAKRRNMGRAEDSLDAAMEAALRDLTELRTALMRALGFERDRPAPGRESKT
jgi:hypothetical protein